MASSYKKLNVLKNLHEYTKLTFVDVLNTLHNFIAIYSMMFSYWDFDINNLHVLLQNWAERLWDVPFAAVSP